MFVFKKLCGLFRTFLNQKVIGRENFEENYAIFWTLIPKIQTLIDPPTTGGAKVFENKYGRLLCLKISTISFDATV